MPWRIRHSRPSNEHATVPFGFLRRVSSMAQELLLRSNSSFLRKGSICVVTRRTVQGEKDGGHRAVGFGDDPEFGAIRGLVGGEQAASLLQTQLVLLPVFFAQVPPVAVGMAGQRPGDVGGWNGFESVAGDDDLAEPDFGVPALVGGEGVSRI